ncbi:hypothetical protein C1H46_012921 [Malus baccata]|uniref:HTH myb-type domain-containing protein n=1 Tax=Malus baccata TaxID=106549 RepID=A0A540MRQ0_MALBA|nr:hypothetical protein C1H46_012921 [Malus baccata]
MDWEEDLGLMLKTKFCSSMSGRWGKLSRETGLKRYGNRCRLRRLNYQKPDIKRGNITEDEEDLIIRLDKFLGNRKTIEDFAEEAASSLETDSHFTKELRQPSNGIEAKNT